ncbi:acyl-CoA thioesterase [Achromobacter piechaudii]|uniref:Thioesterase domain-containing protein n=1 Tax=Achromobacter piechaudii TaxID=72556 RepID=A0A6S7CW12_9BURK|nr:thioesterase family protein [Achromobacter piechaudii]CAB3868048.1 hypothetical protein LMG1861_02615 [Achromobacter piechaudii]
MTERPQPTERDEYSYLLSLDTRWGDNDVYGHVNNVVYYAFFDTAVNKHLIEQGVLDIARSDTVGLVVDTQCSFFSSIAFPDEVHAGLKVVHLGKSSVRYEIALFRNDNEQAAALGRFVHVYVDRATNTPVPIPAPVLQVLKTLMP